MIGSHADWEGLTPPVSRDPPGLVPDFGAGVVLWDLISIISPLKVQDHDQSYSMDFAAPPNMLTSWEPFARFLLRFADGRSEVPSLILPPALLGSFVSSGREPRGRNSAKVAELADALDLGSSPARGGGSTPPFRTRYLLPDVDSYGQFRNEIGSRRSRAELRPISVTDIPKTHIGTQVEYRNSPDKRV